ncbi:MAG: glutamate racemase [Peptostreptococcaceae bacterium]|nr:glutamate racemase [Peptostreptococcaceae bacterium]
MNKKNRAIGVFDSGLGGLTVLKEISKVLPNEEIVYFGDTARVPYGPRSSETVTKYTFQSINFLLENNIKAIVIACNTASARSLAQAQERYNIPIIGVIKPGAKGALQVTENNRIGIIGTEGTISSRAYEYEILRRNENAKVYSKACPLFVPIVEEGWANSKVAELTAREYLSYFDGKDIDTLIMGCTHYPILHDTIHKVTEGKIKLVNPAVETALRIKYLLEKNDLLNDNQGNNRHKFFVSDLPERFQKIGEDFLNRPFENVSVVEIQKY